MATKIARATQKLFGSNAGAAQLAQFGSLAASAPQTYSGASVSPALIQALAGFLTGWDAAVIGANSPAIEDMNSLCYLFAYQIAYLLQTGIPEWDSATNYFVGSIVNDGSGNLYVSLTNSNINNALTSATNWIAQGNSSVTAVSNTYQIVTTDNIIRGDTTSAGFTVTLPTIATSKGKKFVVKNIGVNLLTVAGHGAETIDGSNTYTSMSAQYNSVTVFNNGTTWDVI